MLVLLLVLLVSLSQTDASNCSDCTDSGRFWCGQCSFLPCFGAVSNSFNCPEAPRVAYNDTFVRNEVLTVLAAASSDDPQQCFNNRLPTMQLSRTFSVDCSSVQPITNCFAYTAIDPTRRVIVLSFRATQGSFQLFDEFWSILLREVPLSNIGQVYSYFSNAFHTLWTSGMGDETQNLLTSHPDFEIWITGYSLGGALASVASSTIVLSGLQTADRIKLVTFGQPRTGDADYAAWHSKTFPYSFRIVHRQDDVPHLPPRPLLFHHRSEVWYDNDMSVGQPYAVCNQADGFGCSNGRLELNPDDHHTYFGKNVAPWGAGGCADQ